MSDNVMETISTEMDLLERKERKRLERHKFRHLDILLNSRVRVILFEVVVCIFNLIACISYWLYILTLYNTGYFSMKGHVADLQSAASSEKND